jgi:TonB family protein
MTRFPTPAILAVLFLSGCNLESGLDKVSNTLMDQFTPDSVLMVPVSNTIVIPDSIPCADSLRFQPGPISTPQAAYPATMRKARKQGKVTVVFIIDSIGTLLDPRVEYATDTSFANSLLQAMKSWKLSPGKRDTTPISCYKRLTIDFQLQ